MDCGKRTLQLLRGKQHGRKWRANTRAHFVAWNFQRFPWNAGLTVCTFTDGHLAHCDGKQYLHPRRWGNLSTFWQQLRFWRQLWLQFHHLYRWPPHQLRPALQSKRQRPCPYQLDFSLLHEPNRKSDHQCADRHSIWGQCIAHRARPWRHHGHQLGCHQWIATLHHQQQGHFAVDRP